MNLQFSSSKTPSIEALGMEAEDISLAKDLCVEEEEDEEEDELVEGLLSPSKMLGFWDSNLEEENIMAKKSEYKRRELDEMLNAKVESQSKDLSFH